jgi:hypothetical protein
VKREKEYKQEEGFEVVLIGSSNVAMIRQTHGHYFGIDSYETILDSLENAETSFARNKSFSQESRRLLQVFYTREYWGKKKVSYETLKNHFCQDISDLDGAIVPLEYQGLVIVKKDRGKRSYSLNPKKKADIEKQL